MKRCRLWMETAVLLSGCAILLSGCAVLPTEEEFDTAPVIKEYEGSSYNKYTVVRGDMVKRISVDAKYQGTVKEEILGEGTASRIRKILVEKGEKVKFGDVILQYDMPEQQKAIKEAKRSIESLALQIRQAKEMKAQELKKWKRIDGSREQKQTICSQYDAEITGCQSSLELAKLDLKSAKEERKTGNVYAGITGKAVQVNTSLEGGYADSDEAVVVLQGKKKNRFRAVTKYASYFKQGEEVTITVAGRRYRAKVRKTNPKKLIYFYPEAELSLKNGVQGSVERVIKEKKNVLYLPASLVYEMGDKKVVYAEGENGVRTIREVTVGERIDNLVEITGGLQENEQIIMN